MLIGEVIRTAFASLRSNALRSLLTMLGIIIGVAAVIAMIALGNGAAGAVKDRIARLGTTTLQINPQRVMQTGIGTSTTAKLTYDDVKSIEAHAFSVVGVPLLDVTDPQAVIGETIRISGRQFKVIGVLARKGTTGFGDNDEQILIPFLTGRFGIFGTDRINDIWARVALGATRRNILLQFLVEAVVLCIAGGLFGIGLGAGASSVLSQSFGWQTSIDVGALVIAFAFAAAVGMIFGVWPARRAAVLDPIEALRYE